MSAEPPWTLGHYIEALVDGVAAAEPASAVRLRQVVGDRTAVIAVDDEQVLVRFQGERLVVTDRTGPADGSGATDRATVLDLLAGRTEVTHAVLDDRLRLAGTTQAIVCISQAIEILLDVSTRAPALQKLADRYRAESPRLSAPSPPDRTRRDRAAQRELELLGRLGLLPGA